MEFFLDTGVIWGYCFPADNFHSCCDKFFSDHPFSEFQYYSTQKVKEELKKLRRKKLNIRDPEISKIARLVHQCVDRMWDKKIKKVSYDNRREFPQLRDYILAIIFPLGGEIYEVQNDATILSNAVFWSLEHSNECIFLTTDWKHILSNKSKIISQAYQVLSREIRLKINGIKEFC